MTRALLAWVVLSALACGPGAQLPPPANLTAPPNSAQVTDNGVVYDVLKQGSGVIPRAGEKVSVHYTGWTMDGTMFDSSVAKGKPSRFRVNEVIAGWTEILRHMKTGSTYRVWIPEHLAYKGQEGFPKGTLVFDLQLISIE